MGGASETKAKRGRGRPTKYTPELGHAIVTAIRAGNYVETAAAAHGISKDSLYAWMRKGATMQPTPPDRAKLFLVKVDTGNGFREEPMPVNLRDFSDAVKKAWASSEVADVARIGIASARSWQAAAWRLERKNWQRWGTKRGAEAHEIEEFQRTSEEGADPTARKDRTDLVPELVRLRRRLDQIERLLMAGGTAALPLDKLLELEQRTIEAIRSTAALQHKINPHDDLAGDFRVTVEVEATGDAIELTEANRVPDLEQRGPPMLEAGATDGSGAGESEKKMVGGTGTPDWDEVLE